MAGIGTIGVIGGGQLARMMVAPAVQLGIADVIADMDATGTTLRQAGLPVLGAPLPGPAAATAVLAVACPSAASGWPVCALASVWVGWRMRASSLPCSSLAAW